MHLHPRKDICDFGNLSITGLFYCGGDSCFRFQTRAYTAVVMCPCLGASVVWEEFLVPKNDEQSMESMRNFSG